MKAKQITVTILAAFVISAGIALIIMKYMDSIFKPRYNYKKIKNLPDSSIPDFGGGDCI